MPEDQMAQKKSLLASLFDPLIQAYTRRKNFLGFLFIISLGILFCVPIIKNYLSFRVEYKNYTLIVLILYVGYVGLTVWTLARRMKKISTKEPNLILRFEEIKLERVEDGSQYLVVALSIILGVVSSSKDIIELPSGGLYLLLFAITISGMIFLIYPSAKIGVESVTWISFISSVKSIAAAATLMYFLTVLLNIRIIRNPIFPKN